MLLPFRLLAKLKFLRGSAFDVFGYSVERKHERRLVDDYEASVSSIVTRLKPENIGAAIALARVPEKIRGYGHVKEASIAASELVAVKLTTEFEST